MGVSKLGLYYRTLRHLKPIQITNRVKRKLFPAKVDMSPAPIKRILDDKEFHYIKRPESIVEKDKFSFLNDTRRLKFPFDWNSLDIPKIWLYNLHYFEGLLCKNTINSEKNEHIERWIVGNPPAKGIGWLPYPNSLRIVNWIKWAVAGNKLSASAEQSLAIQIRYMMDTMEYQLLGNHLFVNIKALIFAGCYFEGKEADKWIKLGLQELERELPEQFLKDGAHFELSPTYHSLLTEDLLDIVNILEKSSQTLPIALKGTIVSALNWLSIMTRPDGKVPLFNDAAYGITPTTKEVLDYANLLNLNYSTVIATGLTDLPESGYFRYEGTSYSFFGDAGGIGAEYIPAHTHCDMLNFELFTNGQPVIVDTGTSTYEEGSRRQLERGTASHNTVQIGTYEQSEVWGGFRVGRRARISNRMVSEHSVEASHNGFRKLKVTHTRRFTFSNKTIQLEDKIIGSNAIAICRFHLYPGLDPKINNNEVAFGTVTLVFENALSISILDFEYAPQFNMCIFSKVIEIEFTNTLISHIKT